MLDQAEEQYCSFPASWDRQKRLKYCYRLLKSKHGSLSSAVSAAKSDWPIVAPPSCDDAEKTGLEVDFRKAARPERSVNPLNDQLVEALQEFSEVPSLLDCEDDAQVLSGVCENLRCLEGAPILTRKDALCRLKCRADVADIIEEFSTSGNIQKLEAMKADL